MGNSLDGLCYRLQNNDEELTEINCEHEEIDAIGDGGAAQVASALATNITLRTLDLGGMDIGDEGAEQLASLLLLNKTLSLIRLHKNKITDIGAGRLALALRYNHTVTTLFIGMNEHIQNFDDINDEIQRLVTINKVGPQEALLQKSDLYGTAYNAQGIKLRRDAENKFAECNVKAIKEPGVHRTVNTCGHQKSD